MADDPKAAAAAGEPAERRRTVMQELGEALGLLAQLIEKRHGSYQAAEVKLAKAFLEKAKPLSERMAAERSEKGKA